MTVTEVKERVEAIRRAASDDEKAHGMEDQLHQDVLQHFAELGHEVAAVALETVDMDFSRWCA